MNLRLPSRRTRKGFTIIELLLGVARSENRTLVVVTHDEHLARRGDRLLRIEDGRLAPKN